MKSRFSARVSAGMPARSRTGARMPSWIEGDSSCSQGIESRSMCDPLAAPGGALLVEAAGEVGTCDRVLEALRRAAHRDIRRSESALDVLCLLVADREVVGLFLERALLDLELLLRPL